MKKILLFIITVSFSVAINASPVCIENIYYELDGSNNTAKVTGRQLPDFREPSFNNVVIPSEIISDGATYSVKSIAEKAFKDDFYIYSIELPNSLSSIGDEAFYGCALKTLVLSDNVKSIGKLSFGHAYQLSSVDIGNGVTSIGERAFEQCERLISLVSGNSVETIGDKAFYFNKALENIEIKSAKSIGEYCLAYCESLSSVILGNNVEDIGVSMFFGCNSLTSITIPGSVKTIGESAFLFLPGLTSIKIPDSVITIGREAFSSLQGLKTVEIYGAKNIGSYCFSNCTNLESVILGNKVETIGEYMFASCTSLTSITIQNGLKTIGELAFSGCTSLKSVSIPKSVTSICEDGYNNEANPFGGCSSLENITVDADNPVYDSRNNCNAIVMTRDNKLNVGCMNTVIPNNVTGIGKNAFNDCSGLTSIFIPGSVKSISSGAFAGCSNLTSITVAGTNSTFDSRGNCNAIIRTWSNTLEVGCKATVIPNTVKSIGPSAFSSCTGLTHITIPNGVSTIRPNAFSGCSNLESITIYNTVTNIGGYAFHQCTKLKEVQSLIEEPFDIDESVFQYRDEKGNLKYTTATLYIPIDTKAKYQATAGWKKFNNIVETLKVLEPLYGEKMVNINNLNGQDLSDNVVDGVYYNTGDGSYDVTDGSIVISRTTNMRQVINPEPGSEDVKNNFTGIILKVAAGKGIITVNAKTSGNAQLVVQIGNGTPMIASKTEKGDVVVSYDVEEETYVYIYAILGNSAARATRASADSEVRIYGITVSPGATGISSILKDDNAEATIYNLSGQRFLTPRKGINIVGGKKVVIK